MITTWSSEEDTTTTNKGKWIDFGEEKHGFFAGHAITIFTNRAVTDIVVNGPEADKIVAKLQKAFGTNLSKVSNLTKKIEKALA